MFFIFSKWGTPLSGFPVILEIRGGQEKNWPGKSGKSQGID